MHNSSCFSKEGGGFSAHVILYGFSDKSACFFWILDGGFIRVFDRREGSLCFRGPAESEAAQRLAFRPREPPPLPPDLAIMDLPGGPRRVIYVELCSRISLEVFSNISRIIVGAGTSRIFISGTRNEIASTCNEIPGT